MRRLELSRGVVTLTGLGLKFSPIIIAYTGGNILLTAIYTAMIVWVIFEETDLL